MTCGVLLRGGSTLMEFGAKESHPMPDIYPQVHLKPLPRGVPFARVLQCLVEGDYGRDSMRAMSYAERYRDTPQVKATFELSLKADVPPGVTGTPAWAGALVASGVIEDVL